MHFAMIGVVDARRHVKEVTPEEADNKLVYTPNVTA